MNDVKQYFIYKKVLSHLRV